MINLGAALYTILTGNTAVMNIVGNKIYPIVIPENTLLPCIVYERSSTVEYSRDGAIYFDNSVDITILSTNYTEVINISTAVYNALNMYFGQVQGINISDSRLSQIDETYANEAFIQKLTFTMKSN